MTSNSLVISSHQLLAGLKIHNGPSICGDGIPDARQFPDTLRHAVRGPPGGGHNVDSLLGAAGQRTDIPLGYVLVTVQQRSVKVKRNNLNRFHSNFASLVFN